MKLLGCFALLLTLVGITNESLASKDNYKAWQINLSYGNGNLVAVDNDKSIQEYRIAGVYFPQSLTYFNMLHIGFDLAFAYLHSSKANVSNRNLQVYSLGPMLQLRFRQDKMFSPYIEAGVSPAYISNVNFADRKLGIHFLFQDFLGVGARINTKYPINFAVRFMHYSNASLSKHNRGTTMPIVFLVGINF